MKGNLYLCHMDNNIHALVFSNLCWLFPSTVDSKKTQIVKASPYSIILCHEAAYIMLVKEEEKGLENNDKISIIKSQEINTQKIRGSDAWPMF